MGSRIPDPAPGELRADVEELLPLIARPGGMPASTMVVLARSPDLLAPFLGWAAALALNGVLSNRDHELLASSCRAQLRLEVRVGRARRSMRMTRVLTEAEIAAVARRIADGGWSASERALLQAADDLHATRTVADETWAVLSSYYDQPALAEILFVVGQYTMLSMVANAAGIDT